MIGMKITQSGDLYGFEIHQNGRVLFIEPCQHRRKIAYETGLYRISVIKVQQEKEKQNGLSTPISHQ